MISNFLKRVFNILCEKNATNERPYRRISRRKLGFEVLEGRELLSGDGLDNEFLLGNSSEFYEGSDSYYESSYSRILTRLIHLKVVLHRQPIPTQPVQQLSLIRCIRLPRQLILTVLRFLKLAVIAARTAR
ncbi:MAG: hypothetical protein LBC74_11295 [Planctomycetaceae bacterium]|jgi:hypothetical protein|nr:hypothetical protein [Planctomycetaceae bacterium]